MTEIWTLRIAKALCQEGMPVGRDAFREKSCRVVLQFATLRPPTGKEEETTSEKVENINQS